MFVCLCRVVTDGQVEEAIRNGADTISDVGDFCGAGTGCGACHQQIQDMIDTSEPQGSGGASASGKGALPEHVCPKQGQLVAIAAGPNCR